MTKAHFNFSAETLSDIAQKIIQLALQKGASACDAEVSESTGLNVALRLGQLEKLEHHQDKNFTVTVFMGQQKGYASSSDFSPHALVAAVDAACSIAQLTSADCYSGLPDAKTLSSSTCRLNLFHPWDITIDEITNLLRECENAGLDASSLITHSDDTTFSTHNQHFMYANSLGFCAGYPTSRHRLFASFLGEQGGKMQSDYWMSVALNPKKLLDAQTIGKMAAVRTVRKLGARKIQSGQYPVLFISPISGSLIAALVEALSGDKLYRQLSFLQNSLHKKILPTWFNLTEDPFILEGLGSCPFDAEGVTVQKRYIIENGHVAGYFLDSYSARQLQMVTTGNAGGVHNLIVGHNRPSTDSLIKEMRRGVMVTELMGEGVNLVTGDYSQGAAGFWVEEGQIAYPIEGITIAGNLQQIFTSIIAVADDAVIWGSEQAGSILIESMTVAGI